MPALETAQKRRWRSYGERWRKIVENTHGVGTKAPPNRYDDDD